MCLTAVSLLVLICHVCYYYITDANLSYYYKQELDLLKNDSSLISFHFITNEEI